MDHSLQMISYIADIGDIVVLMARRKLKGQDSDAAASSRPQKKCVMICHVFSSEDVSANTAAFWFVIPLIRGLVAAPAPAHYTHLKRLAFGWKTHKWTHSWRPSNNIFHSAQNHISDWMSCLSRRALSAWPRFLPQTATEFPWMQNWPGCCPSFPLLARLNRTDSFFFNTNYLWDSEAMRLQCLLIAFLILTLFLLLVG